VTRARGWPASPHPYLTLRAPPLHTHTKTQDDVGYADDAAAEAGYGRSGAGSGSDEDDFDDPDGAGYVTATASLGEGSPSLEIDVLEARQAEGEAIGGRGGWGGQAPRLSMGTRSHAPCSLGTATHSHARARHHSRSPLQPSPKQNA